MIKVPTAITEAKAKEVKANWDTSYGGENSGKTALLGGGADYVPISMTAVDAQTVEQLKMTGEIACAVYHVPPYKAGVGDAPATDNIEALEQQYYSQCLQIHIESIELLLDEGLDVGNDSNVEFSVDSLLRMDTERRYAAYAKGVNCAVWLQTKPAAVRIFRPCLVVHIRICNSRTLALRRSLAVMLRPIHLVKQQQNPHRPQKPRFQ